MNEGRLVLLMTSPRVAPGLLSADAWDVLRAGTVVCASPDHPQLPALDAAAVVVEVVGAPSPASLVERARTATIVWLGSADGDPGLTDAVAALVGTMAERGDEPPEIEVLAGSFDVPGARLLDLVAVMNRLRSPGGCPWDREQTHRSLATYLLEETYETLEAIETDPEHLREELGDLLLQVVFHARIAEEQHDDAYTIDDVAAGIIDKLIRRHPHVFGDDTSGDAQWVEGRWEELKREEKGRTSALDGIPPALPALSLAAKTLSRAAAAGVAPGPDSAQRSGEASSPNAVELGDRLLETVAQAQAAKLDPEQALRDAVRRYAEAVRALETGT